VAQWVSPVPPRWQLPDVRAGDLLSAGATQLTEHLAHDPLLKSIEQVWNANPLRDVIPLDWAGIVWALRTVWLRSLSQPSAVPTVAELNAAVWRSSLDIWNEAGRRWLGQSSFDPAEAAKGGDKRFAAPVQLDCPGHRQITPLTFPLRGPLPLPASGGEEIPQPTPFPCPWRGFAHKALF
jgi:polyhydroxyalkanoate synthase